MNKQRVRELLKVNLRYANPQQTTQQRGKGKIGRKLTRSLYWQYFYSGLIFLLVYGLVMGFVNFSQLPGRFTYYVALFGIIAFSQGISAIYNVFFESNDLPSFLPLPFTQGEIFTAKILIITLSTVPLVLPVVILFILTGIRAQVFWPLAIILGLLLFVVFMSIIFALCSLIVFGLTKTNFFKKHRQLVTSLLLIIAMGASIVGVLTLNQQANGAASGVDQGKISLLLPFFYGITEPFQLSGILSWLGLLLVAGGLLVILGRFFIPKLLEQLSATMPTEQKINKKHVAHQSLAQILAHYNLRLIGKANLMLQMVTSSVMFPLIFAISFSVSGDYNFSRLGDEMLGVTFVGGILVSLVTTNQSSLPANAISLEKQNFEFIRSLPLEMRTFLKAKFLIILQVQEALACGVIVIIGVLLHFPMLHLVSLLAGSLLGTYLSSLYYFYRDYRLLQLDWTEISQLFTRGMGKLGVAINMFVTLFVGALLLTFTTIGIKFTPLVVNLLVGIVILGGSIGWLLHYRQIWRTKLL